MLVRFQIFLIIALSSSLACSKLPVRKASGTGWFVPKGKPREGRQSVWKPGQALPGCDTTHQTGAL